ncbi:MAG: nucleoside hydrolase [Lachnospiraceae bacterium]|nr:nucleoside hydrolase [Lachnospiraceae bacterium]
MKRKISLFLLAMVLVVTFAGCGKYGTAGGVKSGMENETESETMPVKTSLSDFNIVTTSANKVILDCDMGFVNDDSFALMFLLQADKLGYIDLMGVVVSGGNKIGAVAVNATLLQLEAVGRTDIPVYIGRDEPLKGFNVERASKTDWPGEVYSNLEKYVTPDNYHNQGELYNSSWGYSETKAQEESASRFMREQVKQYPGEVTILCVGPATNVALACQEDDTFAQNTAGIIYMGGKLKKDASFNWWYDADAVKICLESDFPKQIICTSEISGTMGIPSKFIEELAGYEKSAVAKFFAERETIANSNKKLWDVVIPAVYMCPELVTVSEERAVTVSVEEDTYGQMEFAENGTKATVVSEVNGQDVYALMKILFGE